jgi:voltage-gated potassium channel
MEHSNKPLEFKGPGYELFIVSISILAIFNLILFLFTPNTYRDQVIIIMSFILGLFLLIDFFYRLFTSPNKRQYFFREFGWLDLLGSLPIIGMQLFRLFRIIRVIRLLREIGSRRLSKDFLYERAASAMATVAFLVILVLQFGSYFIVGAEERSANANITTGFDAIWWAFVTITTVGFGDEYPVTNYGRIIGTFVIITGVVLFSVLTGFIATRFYNVQDAKIEESLAPVRTDLEAIQSLLEEQAQSLRTMEDQITKIQDQLNTEDRG